MFTLQAQAVGSMAPGNLSTVPGLGDLAADGSTMSQFDHASDDQSTLANKLVMDLKRTKALKPRKPRKRLEAELQEQCDGLLGYDGWRIVVTDPPHLRGLGVIEKGIPDRLYIRYVGLGLCKTPQICTPVERSLSEVLWIEWKKPGGTPSTNQVLWKIAERARGALVWTAGIDFPATLEGFKAFYRDSGMAWIRDRV